MITLKNNDKITAIYITSSGVSILQGKKVVKVFPNNIRVSINREPKVFNIGEVVKILGQVKKFSS